VPRQSRTTIPCEEASRVDAPAIELPTNPYGNSAGGETLRSGATGLHHTQSQETKSMHGKPRSLLCARYTITDRDPIDRYSSGREAQKAECGAGRCKSTRQATHIGFRAAPDVAPPATMT
jgi:hypothetical protein